MLYDELLGKSLLVTSLITESGLAPRSKRSGMTDGRLTFTTTVGVIAGVHYRTANGRSDTLVAGLTCLTNLNGVMLDVTNLADCSLAVESDDSYLAGRKTDESLIILFRDELSCGTSGTDKLTALAGVKLNVVNESTGGDVCKGQGVTGLDISLCAGVNNVAVLKSNGSDDVALLAGLVLEESDVSGTVGVVLDTDNLCSLGVVTTEVDDTVLNLVSTASVTNGDLTVGVTSCVLLLDNYQALLGRKLSDLLEGSNRHMSSGRCRRLIFDCRHYSFPPT